MNHSELSHQWAHAPEDKSRKSGNMSFSGSTLYSYGTPIAKRYKNKRGEMVLVSEHNYSMTTAKHLNLARRAVSHLPCLAVPRYIIGESGGRYRGGRNAAEDHAVNLAHLKGSAAGMLASAQRVQRRSSAEWRAESAARILENWKAYAAFFGIRRKAPEYPAAEWSAALSRAARIENPEPEELARREKVKEQRAKRERANYKAEFARYCADVADWNAAVQAARAALDPVPTASQNAQHWRDTGAFISVPAVDMGARAEPTAYPDANYKTRRKALSKMRELFDMPHAETTHSTHERIEAVLLRVDREDIVTSQGARVPLAAAPMVWNLVQRARASGGFAPTPALGRLKIGDYGLDRIDADGTLHAGCHSIGYAELELLARKLGLAS